jgi:hypothetical protein
MADRETLLRLRDVLARELETITRYEAHAAEENDPEIKALFQHLANEEKEHVSEVYEALLTRDDAQRQWATQGEHSKAIREQRFEASVTPAAPKPPDPPEPPRSPSPPPVAQIPPVAPPSGRPGIRPTPPTVGSLFGVPQS